MFEYQKSHTVWLRCYRKWRSQCELGTDLLCWMSVISIEKRKKTTIDLTIMRLFENRLHYPQYDLTIFLYGTEHCTILCSEFGIEYFALLASLEPFELLFNQNVRKWLANESFSMAFGILTQSFSLNLALFFHFLFGFFVFIFVFVLDYLTDFSCGQMCSCRIFQMLVSI